MLGLIRCAARRFLSLFNYGSDISKRELADFYLGTMIIGEGQSNRGIAYNGWSKIVDDLTRKYLDYVRSRITEELYHGWDSYDIAESSESDWPEMFMTGDFPDYCGGQSWSDISKAYLNLKGSTSIEQRAIWIDHINDISHNTGSLMFDKYRWFGEFSGAKSVTHYILVPFATPSWLMTLAHDHPEIFAENTKLLQALENMDFDINDFPELLQLKIVIDDPESIKDIDNPSEQIQLVSVSYDGLLVGHIKNPSERVQLAAVENNGYAIQFIDNPSPLVVDTYESLTGYTYPLR